MTDKEKALKIADKLVDKAKQERDTKGYRENLGYDSIYKLEKLISKLDLDYVENADVREYFNRQCDTI